MSVVLAAKVGELRESEAKQFLKYCFDLKINTEIDLRWLSNDNYPMLFRGATGTGKIFVELWEEDRLLRSLPSLFEVLVEDESVCSVVMADTLRVTTIGSWCPPELERRRRQSVFRGRERRGSAHSY